jgi:hypothetical protein
MWNRCSGATFSSGQSLSHLNADEWRRVRTAILVLVLPTLRPGRLIELTDVWKTPLNAVVALMQATDPAFLPTPADAHCIPRRSGYFRFWVASTSLPFLYTRDEDGWTVLGMALSRLVHSCALSPHHEYGDCRKIVRMLLDRFHETGPYEAFIGADACLYYDGPRVVSPPLLLHSSTAVVACLPSVYLARMCKQLPTRNAKRCLQLANLQAELATAEATALARLTTALTSVLRDIVSTDLFPLIATYV